MSGRRWSDRWFRRGQEQARASEAAPARQEEETGPWTVLLGTSAPPDPTATATAESGLTVTHAHPDVPDLAVVHGVGDVAPAPDLAPELVIPETVAGQESEPALAVEPADMAEERADLAAAEAAADRRGPALIEPTPADDPAAPSDGPAQPSPRRAHLREQYVRAWELGDLSAVQLAAGALLDDGEAPAGLLHDLALVAVRRRRWDDALAAATSALAEASGDGAWVARPSAVLLALAAAATGDVDAAKHAYDVLDLDADPARASAPGRVVDDVWVAVRLNPSPSRPGESRLLLDDQDLSTEVVWARAESRLTARIAVVPTPASGHRFGDLILLAPAASGEVTLAGSPVPVVDELDRIDAGGTATLDVTVTCPGTEDSAALVAAFAARGATAQDWTATVHGLPGGDLRGTALAGVGHGVTSASGASVGAGGAAPWRQRRRFGVCAPAADAREVLAAWVAQAPGRSAGTPVEAC